VPNRVSWATELGLDLATLQSERPSNPLQKQSATLHADRARAFAEYQRLVTLCGNVGAEILVFAKYEKLTRTLCKLTGQSLPPDIVARDLEHKRQEWILKNTCYRCGFVRSRQQPTFVDGLCSSCSSLTEKALKPRRSSCKPWTGNFAPDDVTPLHPNGQPVLPGPRVCGYSDCVNPKHITKEKRK